MFSRVGSKQASNTLRNKSLFFPCQGIHLRDTLRKKNPLLYRSGCSTRQPTEDVKTFQVNRFVRKKVARGSNSQQTKKQEENFPYVVLFTTWAASWYFSPFLLLCFAFGSLFAENAINPNLLKYGFSFSN